MAFFRQINRIAMRFRKFDQIPAFGNSFRTGRSFTTSDLEIDVVKLMKQPQFQSVIEDIQKESNNNVILPFGNFKQLCGKHGLEESDIQVLANSLETTGSILQVREGDKIVSLYLQPEFLHKKMMNTVDPKGDRHEERREKLALMETRFKELNKTYGIIDQKAERIASLKTFGLASCTFGVMSLFVRWTYYEYSWDLMEPITFFASGYVGVACMFYVVWSKREFSTEESYKEWKKKYMQRQFPKMNFDPVEYETVKETIEHLQSALPENDGSDPKIDRDS